MERSDPPLVPQWLRNAGSSTGGGSPVLSPSLHSDVISLAPEARDRNCKSKSDVDNSRLPFLDRAYSSNSRRISSNGPARHAYSSFNRSPRYKEREKEKDRLTYADTWERSPLDPLGSLLNLRENDHLRRSHSMLTRNPAEFLPRKFPVDVKIASYMNQNNGSGSLRGLTTLNSHQKTVFERDFPSLGNEDKHGVPDAPRVSSPVQGLPAGNSAFMGGEGWTSALVEVPSVVANNGVSSPSTPQSGNGSSVSGAPCGTSGLNMAEALVQAPSRVQAIPEVSTKTQRLEEMALKQSRQLIPVTPAVPKVLGSDKSKTKTSIRPVENNLATSKNAQQLPSVFAPASLSHSGVQIKSDLSKTSRGKLLVLKHSRENGLTPSPKDNSTSNNSNGKDHSIAVPPTLSSAPIRSTNSPKEGSITVEKRPLSSQAQSRNDFFRLLKKQTSMKISPDPPGPYPCIPAAAENPAAIPPPTPITGVTGAAVAESGNGCEVVRSISHLEEKKISFEAMVCPEEEEAAFLRSLGWEESSGDDEGLTEEEIKAFYEEYMKLRPSLKLHQGMLPKLLEVETRADDVNSSELSSAGS